jgi:anti-anti-sigma regulatory factor
MFDMRQVSDDEVILVVNGPLLQEATADFQAQIDVLMHSKHATVTLDFTNTTAIVSACLGKIIRLRSYLVESQRTLRIRGCSDNLYSMFVMLKFNTMFSIKQSNDSDA